MLSVHRLRIPPQFPFIRGAEEAPGVLEDKGEHARRGPDELWVEILQRAVDGEVVLGDEGVEAVVPGVDVALHEDDFGVRVSGDEVLGEADAGRVGHGAVVAQQPVPVAPGEGVAGAVVLGFEGGGPQGQVGGLVEGRVAVVGGDAAEEFERGLHGDGAGSRHAQ